MCVCKRLLSLCKLYLRFIYSQIEEHIVGVCVHPYTVHRSNLAPSDHPSGLHLSSSHIPEAWKHLKKRDEDHWEKGDHSGARFDLFTVYGHIPTKPF